MFKEDVFPFKSLPTTIYSLFLVLDIVTILTAAHVASTESLSSLERVDSPDLAVENLPKVTAHPTAMFDILEVVEPTGVVDAPRYLNTYHFSNSN